MKNPHDILGINENASDTEARKAFKKLAMIHHPDRGGDEKTFQDIKKAFDTITGNDAVNNPKARIYKHMCDLFSEIISSAAIDLIHTDIKNVAVDLVKKRRSMDKQEKVKAERKLKRMANAKGRMKTKNSTHPNLFEGLIDQNIEGITKAITEIDEHIEMCNEMLTILRDYDYKYDSRDMTSSGFASSSPMSQMDLQNILDMLNGQ